MTRTRQPESSTTFMFGLRRSGHHGIIQWLRKCHEAAGISTAHIDDAYCGHLRYGDDETPRIVSIPEANALKAGKAVTFVSIEDYPYNERGKLPLFGTPGKQNTDVLILRDWPNLVASRIGLIAKDSANGLPTLIDRMPWNGVATLWKGCAEIIASGGTVPQHINYNRWVADPIYHHEIAAKYGVLSSMAYKQDVP